MNAAYHFLRQIKRLGQSTVTSRDVAYLVRSLDVWLESVHKASPTRNGVVQVTGIRESGMVREPRQHGDEIEFAD